MRPTIYLALTHDCELRGDGSGETEALVFTPMRKLMTIYEKYNVPASFTPDVMQQLAFRRRQNEHPSLKTQADAWDELMLLAYRSGHDIQLHLHTQWLNAEYSNGRWSLSSAWSLLDYAPEAVLAIVTECKSYLERLLRQVNPAYRCEIFRASALAIAPSAHLLDILVKAGITLDVSVAGGLYVDTQHVQVDYRQCEETLLPFYPQMDDARKISERREPILCVPIHTFHSSRSYVFWEQLQRGWQLTKQRVGKKTGRDKHSIEDYGRQHWSQRSHSSRTREFLDKGLLPYLTGKFFLADTGRLSRSHALFRQMLASIRKRALFSGEAAVPVVITNHTKDIWDYNSLERFIAEASQASDIRFITLTELADGLREQKFPIRKS